MQYVYEHFDPAQDKMGPWLPLGIISDEIENGIELLFADPDDALGYAFVKRALNSVERSRSALASDPARFSPTHFELAELSEYYGIALFILHKPGYKDAFVASARSFMEWLKRRPSRDWHDQDQSYFISAISLFLATGHVEDAKNAFALAAGVRRWWHPECLRLQELTREVSSDGVVSEPTALILRARFDQVRRPHFSQETFWRPSTFRLELAMVLQRWVIAPEREWDPRGVLQLIGIGSGL